MAESASHPEIEPELQGKTPRRLGFGWGTRLARLLTTLICFGVPLMIGALLGVAHREAADLGREGRSARAEVTGKHRSETKSGDEYHLDYRFPAGGQTVAASDVVSRDSYQNARSGDSLTVTYLPSNPHIQRLGKYDSARAAADARVDNWIVAVIAVISIGTWLFVDRYFRRMLYVLRNGVAVRARILEWDEPLPGSYPIHYITYEYEVPGRDPVRRRLPVKSAIAREILREETATVLYDPRRPEESHFYRALNEAPSHG